MGPTRGGQCSARDSNRRMRRRFLWGAGGVGAGMIGAALSWSWRDGRTPVFIARHQNYSGALVRTIVDGLAAIGVTRERINGRRVLLKPNLVEPSLRVPHMTTHPAIICAAIEAFRKGGADVVVGEGSGHVRDTEAVLAESGVGAALALLDVPFVDLNYDEVRWTENQGHLCGLEGFFLPRSVLEADLIVSMPKMKTHHWVGVTASVKNMYGVIPGAVYGWPKNVLHHCGIPETVVDINVSVPPCIAIVDGISCMEGDGPIHGTAKHMGLVVIGAGRASVDATICRIMDIDPYEVGYLLRCDSKLGSIDDVAIAQRGEPWKPLVSPFELLSEPHLRQLSKHRGVLVS
jgi:uncharacterized protein (DUF362 family)